MSEEYGRNRWRRSEIFSLATIATVLGWAWHVSGQTHKWDQTTADMAELKPIVAELVKMESANEAHWQDIARYFGNRRQRER